MENLCKGGDVVGGTGGKVVTILDVSSHIVISSSKREAFLACPACNVYTLFTLFEACFNSELLLNPNTFFFCPR